MASLNLLGQYLVIFCDILDTFLLESVDTLRKKLASICLRDFLHWMNSETPGAKRRRSSLGDESLDDLLRQILDGLCREGSASVVFIDVVAPLLA